MCENVVGKEDIPLFRCSKQLLRQPLVKKVLSVLTPRSSAAEAGPFAGQCPDWNVLATKMPQQVASLEAASTTRAFGRAGASP